MKKFKVEHNDLDKPVTYITLYNPPYENENILAGIKWKEKDVIITDVTPIFDGEE